MSPRPRAVALWLVACAACATPQQAAVPVTPRPAVTNTGDAAEPAQPASAAARAAVAALRARADADALLAPWSGAYGGVPPWDRLKLDAFAAAFALGIELRRAEVDVIALDPAPATFANTFAPLQDAGRHLGRAETLFGVLVANLSDPQVRELERAWKPKLAAAEDAIVFDPALFARIAAVHAARERSGLTPEQRRLVELTYDDYVLRGARLDAARKKRLGELNQALAALFAEFGNRVLADENTWTVLERPAELAGVPESLRAVYRSAAEERGLAGKWAVVNTRSSVDPFLTASTRRDLREKVWRAFKSRGDNGDGNDTNTTLERIVKLRAERAALLGYRSHAHWRMADTMAVDPDAAMALMLRVWPAAVARVREEVRDMQAIAKREGAKIRIEPWDYLFYAEKVRKAKYDLDQAELRPYFELNAMIAASFFMAERLYDLAFTEITGKVPVFHPDVRVWEVKDAPSGRFVGLFYGDYFARTGKRSGAWATPYQIHESFAGRTRVPITSNNNNFVRAGAEQPVLISLDDAETLFHEFGHALHGLLSEVEYPGLASTPRDFVEYPSQVHEHWVLSRPVLDRFARHVETGEAMPQALVDNVERSSKFNQGYATVEYLASAIVEMKLHVRADGSVDAAAFERETLREIGMPREVALRHRLPQFNHLFTSDAYSAGYYSYLWSEVMDADTRQAFVEAGDPFHRPTAEKLRRYILAPGNASDRAAAYRAFRGRDPDVRALLEKRGFPVQ